MSLINNNRDGFSRDKQYFEDMYEMTYDEFITNYKDIEIELNDKVVIVVEPHNDTECPINIISAFIPEEIKHNYKATLIYAGHISFIKLEYNNGRIIYLYKDDECYPQTLSETFKEETLNFEGYEEVDVMNQIERLVQSTVRYGYVINMDNVIILEGE